jgi:hypothetical protein
MNDDISSRNGNKPEIVEISLAELVGKVESDGRDNVLESSDQEDCLCLVVVSDDQEIGNVSVFPLTKYWVDVQ